MQKQNCNLPIGRKNSLSRVSKVTCGLLFCLTTCAFAVDGKVNMGSNGVEPPPREAAVDRAAAPDVRVAAIEVRRVYPLR